jgi:hypothetical protein
VSGRVSPSGEALVAEAARLFVEEAHTDYGLAKRRAAERLGLSSRSGLPDNRQIEAAVLDYQRLFGGPRYTARLKLLRDNAVRALRLLAPYGARLSGAVVSGAISDAHRVQIHAFPEQAERVELFLHERGLDPEQDERDYRYGNGRVETVPLVRFEAGGVGLDVALFQPGQERHAPLSPVDGRPARRLTLAEAEALASTVVETLLR